MKYILSLLILVSFSSHAAKDLYGIKDEIFACKKDVFGCSTEQEIEIAKYNGIIMDASDLKAHLKQDKQKSVFIPLSLNNDELLTLAIATSLGVVAFKNDQEIMDVIQSHKSEVTNRISSVGNFLGSTPGSMAIAAGSYFMGVYYKDNKLMKAGLFMVSSSIATGIVVGAVKLSVGRARPYAYKGPYSFDGGKSFYSGHTTEIFTIATVISEMYKKDYPIVPYIAYGIAAITGYSRIHSEAHWASDVIVGAIAGHLITKLFMNYMNGNPDNRYGIEFTPGIDPYTGQFLMSLQWHGKAAEDRLKCSDMQDGFLKTEACLTEAFDKAKKHR